MYHRTKTDKAKGFNSPLFTTLISSSSNLLFKKNDHTYTVYWYTQCHWVTCQHDKKEAVYNLVSPTANL